jgi:Kef-type K+ transport system membrane component KefB
MKKFKNLFFYIVIIGVFSFLMKWIIEHGKYLELGKKIIPPTSKNSQWGEFIASMKHNIEHPLAILLAQIITILIVAKIFGWIFKKIGQPSVIGEIIAGIVLGPSLIGSYFPEYSAALFPKESLPNLQFLSQIGLILFMFVVGMELDLKVLKNKANDAVIISHASIVFPFTLGLGFAYTIYNSFAPKGVQFLSFGLFIGIAMSITAFPVLARIVQERNLHKTKIGTVVITCAAADDITAWCILAAVIAYVKAGSFISALYIIALAALYVIVMIKLVKPFLKQIGDIHASKENLSKPVVAIFFLTLILSAYATEIIGIHALFGAFLAGVIMPDNMKFRNLFIEKVEDISLVLLLPLFFVFTGLRTQIGLLDSLYLWQTCGLIILVAVVGKFVGSALAAKFVGQSWKDSLMIGALMNTRGLMELVVLNIGYDLGVLTPEVFAMMVIMALVTTFMTGPALDLINYIFKKQKDESIIRISKLSKFNILLSFGNSDKSRNLLRLSNSFVKKMDKNATITAMHLSLSDQLNQYNLEEYQTETFAPIIEESKELNQKITTFFKASVDIENDIVDVANKGSFDLLIVGYGNSIYDGTFLGKLFGFTTKIINPDRIIDKVTGKEKLFESNPFDERIRFIIAKTEIPVGILVERDLSKINKVFIPIEDENDDFIFEYSEMLIENSDAEIVVWQNEESNSGFQLIKENIISINEKYPNKIHATKNKSIDKNFLNDFDLILISIETWKKINESDDNWLEDCPSLLIIKY